MAKSERRKLSESGLPCLDFWDYEKNTLTPDKVGTSSRKVAYWKCPTCGYSWEDAIRLVNMRKSICPKCSNIEVIPGVNDLATLQRDLMIDWDWEMNTKDPKELKETSHYNAHWVCHKCGHKWVTRLDTRTRNGCGCPVCSRTLGRGSSIADYTLYKLVDTSLKGIEDVRYRNRVNGIEVDVLIPNRKICIEYDGCAWHNKYDRIESDIRKDDKLLDLGYSVYRIKERDDKIPEIGYVDDYTVTAPLIREDNYSTIKELYAKILLEWGIIKYENVSEEYWSLNRQKVKSLIQKPPYDKSFAHFLKTSEYDKLTWDFSKNIVKPDEIYARTSDIVYMRCKYGHSVSLQASLITRSSYGCRYCSFQKLEKGINGVKEVNYNAYLLLPEIRELVKAGDADKGYLGYICPFCGKVHKVNVDDINKSDRRMIPKCCLTNEKVNVVILGKTEGNVYYSIDIRGIMFLGVCKEIELDYYLRKYNTLNIEELPRKFLEVGVPVLYRRVRNSYLKLPILEDNIGNITYQSDKESVNKAIDKLKYQKNNPDKVLFSNKKYVLGRFEYALSDLISYLNSLNLLSCGTNVLLSDKINYFELSVSNIVKLKVDYSFKNHSIYSSDEVLKSRLSSSDVHKILYSILSNLGYIPFSISSICFTIGKSSFEDILITKNTNSEYDVILK